MADKFITVKEISQLYGLSPQTINRYSDVGLLSVAFKKGNVRFYERTQANRRLKQITSLSKEGYSLTLIRKKLLGN
ncbi:MAG: MerR family transcriptional regulator [Candidatus Omnitrophota bacterium]|jgi:DNA-binding transcriptional MerR regulator